MILKMTCQFVVAWAQEILTHTKPQSLETSVFGKVGHHIFFEEFPGKSHHRPMPMFHREISSEQNFHNLQLFDIPNV